MQPPPPAVTEPEPEQQAPEPENPETDFTVSGSSDRPPEAVDVGNVLTIDALMNAEYKPLDWIEDSGWPAPPDLVKLEDGRGFESVINPEGVRPPYYRYDIRIAGQFENSGRPPEYDIVFGDLDGDGTDEAVVLLVANGGMGNSEGLYLAVVANDGGQPRHVASSVRLGDARSGGGGSPEIRDGAIHYEKRAYADADAMCCPSLTETRVFRLGASDTLAEDEREDIGADDWR